MSIRRIWLATVILALVEPVGFASAARLLQGQVLESHGGTTKPAANAQVWIVHVGNPYTTGLDGSYRVLVPEAIQIHQEITLFVKRKGWLMATPVGGKLELPAALKADILLSPESSPEFLAPVQLAKLIESLPEKMKSQVKADGKAGDTDPKQVVRDYAEEHQLSENDTIAKVDALVLQYEQSPEPEKRCLAAMYRKDVDQATATCRAAATSKSDLLKQKRQEVENLSKSLQRGGFEPLGQSRFAGLSDFSVRLVTSGPTHAQFMTESRSPAKLEEAKRQLIKLTEEVAGEFKSTGDAYYANYQFDKALEAYEESLNYLKQKDLPTLWADMQRQIGLVRWQIGIRTQAGAIHEHLSQAVNRYREAQTVYTKTEFPEAWAAIEMNLGTVLSDQGRRAEGKESLRLLALAEAAYRDALSVYTKAQLPQDWAATQMGLGTVLSDQGSRTSGANGFKLFAQAVESFGSALTVYTKRDLPQQWTATASNLTEALFLSGQHVRTRSQLEELLAYEGLDTGSKIALLYISVANSVVLSERKQALTDFETISHALGQQGADFFLTWDFSSIKSSISQNHVYAKHQQWLLDFLSALEHGRRDEMLAATGKARSAYLKISLQ
ncbi:MAG: hypothetical protein IPK92_18800 [Nitrospira sp.]|nr:hypothetical protein [Nitrospira sp.]